MFTTCKKCGYENWSVMDKNYMRVFGDCWHCDKEKWERKELSTEEFEKREQKALKIYDTDEKI